MKPKNWVCSDFHSVIVGGWSVQADGNHFDGELLCDFNCGIFAAAVHNDDFKKARWIVLAPKWI